MESRILNLPDCRGTQIPRASSSSKEKFLPSGVRLDTIFLTTLKNEPLSTLCLLNDPHFSSADASVKKRVVASAYPLAHN